ncbi:MAG: hypothetical protein ABIR62_17200 [Dokdonella sp.]|uniref:hypothetical protein n=1 Tax=Dokdonella sp. TaxID=2291710 RepID=UPI00326345C3
MPTSDSRMIKPAADDRGVPTLWLGLMYGHLMRVRDGPVFEAVETPWPHEIGEAPLDVLGRTVDGQHEFWVATRQSGVFRQRGGQWTSMRPPGVVGTWRALSLVEQFDRAGHSWIWASTNRGLARFDGENVSLLGREIGLPGIELLSLTLLPDAQGRQILWLGSVGDGIQRVDVTDPMHPITLPVDDLPAPPDRTAYGAMRDSTGRIYVCTNNGVQVLTTGPGGYESRLYTRKDGLVHDECNTDAQFIDANDRFWTGMLGGVAVFDPGSEISDRHPSRSSSSRRKSMEPTSMPRISAFRRAVANCDSTTRCCHGSAKVIRASARRSSDTIPLQDHGRPTAAARSATLRLAITG